MITHKEIKSLGWKRISKSKALGFSLYKHGDYRLRIDKDGKIRIKRYGGRAGSNDIEHTVFNGTLMLASDLRLMMYYLNIDEK